MNGSEQIGALSQCFSTGDCNRCGACCTFLHGFEIPTPSTVQNLKSGVQGSVKESFQKLPGPCTYLGADNVCSVYDLRIQHPELFVACNAFVGNKIGFVRKKKGLSPTSSKEELLFGFLDTIIIPASSSINFREMFLSAERSIKSGYFEGLDKHDYIKCMKRFASMGNGLMPLYLEGYYALFVKFRKDPKLMGAALVILDFLKRNGILKIIVIQSAGLRAMMSTQSVQIRLLFFKGGGDFFRLLVPGLKSVIE